MTNKTLAHSYMRKAVDRLDVLDLLFKKNAFSDVIREAQEIVELSLKGMLRFVGVEPPKFHDVASQVLFLLLNNLTICNASGKRRYYYSKSSFWFWS